MLESERSIVPGTVGFEVDPEAVPRRLAQHLHCHFAPFLSEDDRWIQLNSNLKGKKLEHIKGGGALVCIIAERIK